MSTKLTFTKTLATVLAVTALTVGMPTRDASLDLPMSEPIHDAQWDVQAFPGGEILQMTGTVEKIWDQLLAINPNYVDDWGVEDPTLPDEANADATTSLVKRTDFTGSTVKCGNKARAYFDHIARGIKYLRSVQGKPRNGAGPGNCGRVSCSNQSGIYWCNDDQAPKTLESFGSIADGAQWVLSRCSWTGEAGRFGYTGGRVYHKTNWNVWVMQDNC